MGAASLMAQHPFLDGGGGECQPHSVSLNIDTNAEQEIPPMGETIASLLPLELPPNIPAMDASNFSGLEPPWLIARVE